MTGLDKILSKISEEAQNKCREIDEQAKAEAQGYWEQAIRTVTAQADLIVSQAQQKADVIRKSAVATAEAAYKRECLRAKNDIINDVIAAAYEKLVNLPDKDYFDVLISLCVSNAQEGYGVMHLCKKDLKRLPKNFEMILAETLDSSKSITVSNIAYDIPNGFVLTYGDVEINCAFHALFDEARDGLKDAVCPVLFGE